MANGSSQKVHGSTEIHQYRTRHRFLQAVAIEFPAVLDELYKNVLLPMSTVDERVHELESKLGLSKNLRGARLQQRKAEAKALVPWLKKFNLTDPWIKEFAAHTLAWWRQTTKTFPDPARVPKGMESNHPALAPSWSSPSWVIGGAVDPPETKIFPWDPQRETESGFRARIEQHIRLRKAWAKSAGLHSLAETIAPKFDRRSGSTVWTASDGLHLHCHWLARRLVGRESPKTISSKYEQKPTTIEQATATLAKVIGLTGYQLAPGRPKKRGGTNST